MRVLIDTDVVLDLLLKRPPFYPDAFARWQAGDAGLDALITRNLGDYVGAPLQVFSPAELLKHLPTP
jgi:hypothetical protein